MRSLDFSGEPESDREDGDTSSNFPMAGGLRGRRLADKTLQCQEWLRDFKNKCI